jgi:hypothetical protein
MAKKKFVKSEIKPTFKVLEENKPAEFNNLIDIYKKDKSKARIYYHLNPNNFQSTRKVLFEWPNGDFKFVYIRKRLGISCKGNMYSSDKNLMSVIYKGGKFYFYNNCNSNAYVSPLTLNSLVQFENFNTATGLLIKNYLVEKFGWIRFLEEHAMFYRISFNTIQSKKLFNLKAMLRHIYKAPYPIASFVHEYNSNTSNELKYLKVWTEMRKQLINIENLTRETYRNSLFQDSCQMAQMVGQKVNCSWSEKRLKQEHDDWSRIITEVMLENEPLVVLKVAPIYKIFAEFTKKNNVWNFELLTTNHELIAEGKRMHHCVGTYSRKVDTGNCAIFRVGGCTLELGVGEMIRTLNTNGFMNPICLGIKVLQYRNYGNTQVPQEAMDMVDRTVNEFNAKYPNIENFLNKEQKNEIEEAANLPF